MSGFEFIFTLFGLLLGLSLVEVLGGLAKALEARFRPGDEAAHAVRLGWLTPLLGIYVMLDVGSFWIASWHARQELHVSGPMLLGGLVFAGSYYLAAHAVFPSEPQRYSELDSHYFRVRRWVFGILTALLLIQILFWMSVPRLAQNFWDAEVIVELLPPLLLMPTAMLLRGRVSSTVVLAVLNLHYIHGYLDYFLLSATGITS